MTEVETKYAIVRDGVVENVALWDGETTWTPPEGTSAVVTDGTVGPGWLYDGQNFTAPPVPDPVPAPMSEVDELAALLVEKGVISADDLKG